VGLLCVVIIYVCLILIFLYCRISLFFRCFLGLYFLLILFGYVFVKDFVYVHSSPWWYWCGLSAVVLSEKFLSVSDTSSSKTGCYRISVKSTKFSHFSFNSDKIFHTYCTHEASITKQGNVTLGEQAISVPLPIRL
jgi:hypothetical protein